MAKGERWIGRDRERGDREKEREISFRLYIH